MVRDEAKYRTPPEVSSSQLERKIYSSFFFPNPEHRCATVARLDALSPPITTKYHADRQQSIRKRACSGTAVIIASELCNLGAWPLSPRVDRGVERGHR